MGGYSPTTGHYSSAIDTACDFICRNTYWDARYPTQSKYGSTEAKLLATRDEAVSQGKEYWITEFGYTKTNTETQRAYVEAFVSWANAKSIDKIFCWVSQPDSPSGESYNIFGSSYTPNPAFYELVNGETPPIDNPPTYGSRSYNTTVAGDIALFSCKCYDDNGLSQAYFSSNNTGAWVNSTVISLSGTEDWANKTLTLNSTIGVMIQYKWFIKDSANQWTVTTILSLTTTAINIPISSNPNVDNVIAGQTTHFNVTWNDVEGLSGFIFGTNNTGSWINESWIDIGAGSPLEAISSVSKTLNDTVGVVVEWQVWCNDTDDNWDDTGSLFVTVEEYPPIPDPAPAIEEGTVKVLFMSGSSLGFQNDINKTVILTVTSGTLNCTTPTITLLSDQGLFEFVALNDVTLQITYSGITDVNAYGDQGKVDRRLTSGNSLVIDEGDDVTIYWTGGGYEFILPISFIIMMVGLIMFIGGPMYGIHQIQKKEYQKGILTILIFGSIGFGLFFGMVYS
jgi:hypothetical protein